MKGQKYPINPNLAQYVDVMVCRECACMPGGIKRKDPYVFTKGILQALAKSYDPVGLYCAPVNRDHDGMWYGGPAEGVVTALRYEEVDGKGVLLADLANFPDWIAEQIDGLQWLSRSIEWIDAPDLAAWYSEIERPIPIERLRFYGTEDYYLTGLALLGQFEPAVPGLGPMPARYAPEGQAEPHDSPLEVIILPAAAAQFEPHRYAAFLNLNTSQEALMGGTANAHDPKRETPPALTAAQPPGAPATPPEGGTETVEGLRAQLSVLSAENESLKAAQAPGITAEEAAQLRANNAQLMASQRTAEIDNEIRVLSAKGHLLPGEVEPYRQLAQLCAGAESITLPGGRTAAAKLTLSAKCGALEAGAETDILGLVKQVLAGRTSLLAGGLSASGTPQAGLSDGKEFSAALSAADQEALKSLQRKFPDLTAAEYSEFKASKTLPARFNGKSQGGQS